MSDCRFLLDNINDLTAREGTLIKGSDAVDVSGAEMVAGESSWIIKVRTVNPAPQHPRLPTSVVLYLDTDGRYENNAQAGTRLGADQVYGIASKQNDWLITREVFYPSQTEFITQKTEAKYSFEDNAYVIEIPFSEVAKDVKAFWRVGIATTEDKNLTVDLLPDGGFGCAAAITSEVSFPAKVKAIASKIPGEAIAFTLVIIALVVITLFKRRKKVIKPESET